MNDQRGFSLRADKNTNLTHGMLALYNPSLAALYLNSKLLETEGEEEEEKEEYKDVWSWKGRERFGEGRSQEAQESSS